MSADQLQIDDVLCARVREFLALQHFPSLRKLGVTACGDTVVLYGSVPSFHDRQMAVAYCQHVTGVHHVVDQLVVSESSAVVRAIDCSPDDRPVPPTLMTPEA
jgi:osmotically-inducible protein OsmY